MIERALLVGSPYDVIVATDGYDAVQQAVEASPDLIILDVVMPNMDGFEACRQLRQPRRHARHAHHHGDDARRAPQRRERLRGGVQRLRHQADQRPRAAVEGAKPARGLDACAHMDGIEPADAYGRAAGGAARERAPDRSLSRRRAAGGRSGDALRGGQQPPRRHRSARGGGGGLRDRGEPGGLRGDGALRERRPQRAHPAGGHLRASPRRGSTRSRSAPASSAPWPRRDARSCARRAAAGDPGSDASITACLPLRIGTSVVGVLAIFRLLPHKGTLEDGDRDLFEVLSAHVAPALLFARVYDGGTCVSTGRAPARPPRRSWTGSRTPRPAAAAERLPPRRTPVRVGHAVPRVHDPRIVRVGGALRSRWRRWAG